MIHSLTDWQASRLYDILIGRLYTPSRDVNKCVYIMTFPLKDFKIESMGPKDCKNVKKNEKKTWHQLSTWGSLSRPFYMV